MKGQVLIITLGCLVRHSGNAIEKTNGRITTRRIAVTGDVEWMDSEI